MKYLIKKLQIHHRETGRSVLTLGHLQVSIKTRLKQKTYIQL